MTKASTRAAVNASPEPFTNWFVSIVEDLFVVGLGYLALQYPIAALGVAAVVIAGIGLFSVVIVRTALRWMTRRRRRGSASVTPPPGRNEHGD